ncbi:bifunctional protein-disulfide isomerase/oxidoreductase DsbC [Chromatiaceae bacterium AAb-1]|nr:bifunctional protein-disulfide isomerase/oxidoreductase DsbC [Chromatiaceae bacterium AAb-1]
MKKLVVMFLGLGLYMTAAVASVQDSSASEQKIRQMFDELGLTVNAISESPVAGLLQIFTNKGLFFVSADGRFFMEGHIYDLTNRVLVNDMAMRGYVHDNIARYTDSAIEYKAKNEKYVVTVFTDPTCGYCRKLHNEMKDYNDAGITVRYLGFPRGGLSSETYLQMQHIWCTKNARGAMNDAKAGKTISPAMCANKVKEHYELGQSFGISGTPAIVLPGGQIAPGYLPVAALLEKLQAEQ